MQQPDHLEHLLTVLRDRQIPLGRDDVQWAFNAPNTKDMVVEWVEEYLGPDTLLSKEELDLFGKLEKNGTVRTINASHDTSTIRPILDDEIRSALETLKASTLAIEEQNMTLQAQQKALRAYRENTGEGEARRKRASEQRGRKYALEKQHVEIAADELFQGLTSQIAAAQQQLKLSNGTLRASLTEMLKGNDRLLARVESLAGELEVQDDHGEDAIMERTKKLAAKLAEFRAEEIRCRLDRIFLENAPNEFKMGQQHKDYDTELTGQSFEQQLSSLYPEISVVAKGSIDQNFVEPVMEQLSQGRERRKAQSGAVLCYITSALVDLTSKLHEVTKRVQNHRSHMIALKALSDSLEAETLRSIREYPSSPSKQQRSLARANENGSLVSIEESSQSLQQLLRLLGISSTDQDGTVGIDKRISAANEERAENVRNQTASLESNTLEVLTTSLQEANGTLQLLRDAMYEDSLYGGFRLADLQLEKSVNALDTELDEIGTAVKNLDLGVLHQQDNKRELFLEQWSK